MKIGFIRGIEVRLHPTFLLMLAIYGILGLITQALMVFSLVVVHELAHLLAARSYGFKIKGFELFPFGGAAYCEDSFEGRKLEEVTMALAGPFINLVLLLGMALLRWQGWAGGEWTAEFIRINFWLAAFNLIPVLPLDGGRVIRALFAESFGFVRTTKFLARAGQVLGITLVVTGFTMWGHYRETIITFLLLGGFFWIAGGKEINAARITFLRGLTRKKEELVHKGLLPSKTLTVYPEVPLIRVVEQFTPDRYTLVAVTGEKFELNKVLTETQVVEAMMSKGIHYQVGELIV